ncbi:FAD-dependent oxidoreductase [uncultured Ruminococcus sp.]|uniref:FAD-dependent oxidoreductase n=1 Tax=uncultured Ruminococcus sp. TaxID=165186 RepID=UPI002621F83A|nr:FAD-dependent oxidoreductase [uncultured Ruminococcus sp.]
MQKMQSIWHRNCEMPRFPALQGDIKADVLVIGGGIAGLLTAYLLGQKGVSAVLVEGDALCSGTTQNTTAKITVQHGLIYHNLLKLGGVEMAQKYYKLQRASLQKYAALCKDIQCDFQRKDNYVYSVENPEILETELDALQRARIPAKFAENLPLPFSTVGAVEFTEQAQFHPLQFLSQIAKSCSVYEHTFVYDIRDNQVWTEHGVITADRIVVATHFPFWNGRGRYYLKLYQHRSYVLALANAPDLNGMYLDEKQTGLSFRNYGDMLLLGGGSHRTGKKGGGWAELQMKAKLYYPDAEEVCRWAAQDCMSLDDLPYIGSYYGRNSQLYVAAGFGKWGMTGAMTAAMVLTDMLTSVSNEAADIFYPSRSIMQPQLYRNLLETASNFFRLTPKRCTHLGCALHWNPSEHSWDCACHGSRFSEDGHVLENPAKRNRES